MRTGSKVPSLCLTSGIALLILVSGVATASAQQLVRSEDAVVALFSLQTELEVDGRMMLRLEGRHEENRKERIEARERLERLYEELDTLFAQYRSALRSGKKPEGEPEPDDFDADDAAPRASEAEKLEEQIEAKERELLSAERAQSMTLEEGHRLREQIRDLRLRMTLLNQQIAGLERSIPTQRDAVTGIWDVTMLPSGDKGVFALFQSGTLVTGQYVLDGPFQGSLDGTLIDRKLLLHRIDSRLGRSMDLHAVLASDGKALRGSWENYDLANGQARTGSWAARRRPARSAESATGEERSPGD